MTVPSVGSFVSAGKLNRLLGWTTLLIGLGLSAALDPWLFDATAAVDFQSSQRPAVRHAQGVVIAMALLQLAMAHLLATSAFARSVRQIAAILTTLGAVSYITGYVLGLWWPALQWLVLVGSLVNFSGFAYLQRVGATGAFARQIEMILPVACFGMLLDFVAGLLPLLPDSFVLEHIGAGDEVRLRMLRLARVAAIALSVLTLLYYGLAQQAGLDRAAPRRGGTSLALGAVGMPLILAVSCFATMHAKYLLPLPATAVVIGVYLGFVLSLKHGDTLERWGWLLIAASTSVGMLIGLYAFDGPIPTPGVMGDYNDLPRRLTRLAHSYCIVLGIMAIFLSRQRGGNGSTNWLANLGTPVFIAGCVVMLSVLLLQAVVPFSPSALRIGPVLLLIGAVACLVRT